MKDASHTTLQTLLSVEHFQGVPRGTKHAGIEHRHVRHGDGMQTSGDGEYHMKGLHTGYHLFFAHLYPDFTLLVLTLGTMTVPATVIAHMHFTTFGTDLDMTTKLTCAASSQGRKCLSDLWNDMMLIAELPAIIANNLPYLKFGPTHCLKMVSTR